MSRKENRIKAEKAAETRQKETAEIIRLFENGLTRTQIHKSLGLAYSTVADRLEAAGYPKGKACNVWTEQEIALVARFAEDASLTAAMIVQHFQGRSESSLAVRLRVARIELGMKPVQSTPQPPKSKQAEELPANFPDWPLPAGAIRDRRGITLPRISMLMEANRG